MPEQPQIYFIVCFSWKSICSTFIFTLVVVEIVEYLHKFIAREGHKHNTQLSRLSEKHFFLFIRFVSLFCLIGIVARLYATTNTTNI